jgi:hypothetical protein
LRRRRRDDSCSADRDGKAEDNPLHSHGSSPFFSISS